MQYQTLMLHAHDWVHQATYQYDFLIVALSVYLHYVYSWVCTNETARLNSTVLTWFNSCTV